MARIVNEFQHPIIVEDADRFVPAQLAGFNLQIRSYFQAQALPSPIDDLSMYEDEESTEGFITSDEDAMDLEEQTEDEDCYNADSEIETK